MHQLNPQSLIPHARGALRPNADIARNTWFQVGGTAEWLFKPADNEDLAAFLKALPREIPLTILGVGSNIIVRDGGIKGVVIRLGRGFVEMNIEGEKLCVGTGALDIHTAAFARDHNIAGLEFLCGIPGTIGGAVAMNAGAYGREMKDVLIEAEIVTREGEIKRLSNAELKFSYRKSQLPEGSIVTRVWLVCEKGDAAAITTRMEEIRASREATQPVRTKTGGSTFKNPEGKKAWQLVDEAGCRGLQYGGAQVSELHCNFLINTGTATAADLEGLGEEVRKKVLEKSGIMLEWEIKRIGERA